MFNLPVYLQLLVGPGVPVPVPREVMDALTGVQVTSNTRGASIFQLTFSLPPMRAAVLILAAQVPLARVVILVVVNGIPEVLMDGVMTHHQLAPGSDSSNGTLTITGEDLSKAMSYLPFNGVPYPAQPENVRVQAILGKYASLGIVPRVVPPVTSDVSSPTQEYPRQQGSDLEYVRQLAAECGYEFYVDPGPLPLQSTAYWGPSIRAGIPQRALNTNMDAETNVDSLNFSFDPEGPEMPIVMVYSNELKTGIPIPIPSTNPLNPPLGAMPPIPKRVRFDHESARRNPGKALMVAMAAAARAGDAVTGSGSLSVSRYGRVLKARQLVGVRGAGLAFDGLYFVQSVTHDIKRGEYKQNFRLVRNGLVSTTPAVIP
jgi:hypothetical protein